MDRLGPSSTLEICWATRGQGRTHGDQRTWWRGLRIAERGKTATLRLLVQITGFLVHAEFSPLRQGSVRSRGFLMYCVGTDTIWSGSIASVRRPTSRT